MCVAVNTSELFCMAHLANIEPFFTILTFHFKYQTLCTCKLASSSWRKPIQVREGAFISEKSEINSRWVIFPPWEWTLFKSVDRNVFDYFLAAHHTAFFKRNCLKNCVKQFQIYFQRFPFVVNNICEFILCGSLDKL